MLAIALLCSAPLARDAMPQEPDYPDIIESLGDVLPASVVARMAPDLDRRLVNGQPLLLLVNPQLKGGTDLPIEERLALAGTTLDADLIRQLGARPDGRREAPVYWQLERVFRDYLRLVFAEVEEGDDLQSLVQRKRALQSTLLVVTVDAQLGVRDERLFVKIAMRLWRIELGREAPFPVRSAEMLYADRALGSVPLPAREADGAFESRQLFAAYRAAIIDAIRGKLAMSLWGNPALREHSWIEPRPDPIGVIEKRVPSSPGQSPAGTGAGQQPAGDSTGTSDPDAEEQGSESGARGARASSARSGGSR